MLAFVNPGDEVIALEPYFDSYAASIEVAGGQRVGVSLFGPDFRLDHAELAAAFTPKTKALLINSPHNPTGVVLDRADLGAIAELAVQHDVLVICDEVYEHLTFDGAAAHPTGNLPRNARTDSAGLIRRQDVLGHGLEDRLGACDPDLINEITAVKQYLSYSSGAPFQPAIARALNEGDEWVEKARLDLQDRRDQFAEGLRSIGLEPILPRGTYFMTTDVRPLGYERRHAVLPRPAHPLRSSRYPPSGPL